MNNKMSKLIIPVLIIVICGYCISCNVGSVIFVHKRAVSEEKQMSRFSFGQSMIRHLIEIDGYYRCDDSAFYPWYASRNLIFYDDGSYSFFDWKYIEQDGSRFHSQNTSSKRKLLRISRGWQQHIKRSMEPAWAWPRCRVRGLQKPGSRSEQRYRRVRRTEPGWTRPSGVPSLLTRTHYCPIWHHLQNTSSKIKRWQISRWQRRPWSPVRGPCELEGLWACDSMRLLRA